MENIRQYPMHAFTEQNQLPLLRKKQSNHLPLNILITGAHGCMGHRLIPVLPETRNLPQSQPEKREKSPVQKQLVLTTIRKSADENTISALLTMIPLQ